MTSSRRACALDAATCSPDLLSDAIVSRTSDRLYIFKFCWHISYCNKLMYVRDECTCTRHVHVPPDDGVLDRRAITTVWCVRAHYQWSPNRLICCIRTSIWRHGRYCHCPNDVSLHVRWNLLYQHIFVFLYHQGILSVNTSLLSVLYYCICYD